MTSALTRHLTALLSDGGRYFLSQSSADSESGSTSHAAPAHHELVHGHGGQQVGGLEEEER